jgi:transaldolase
VPGCHGVKLFVDSANLEDIEQALRRGFASGITTNPSIFAKEQRCDVTEHMRKIIDVVRRYGDDIPLSVEVFTTDPDLMREQALAFLDLFGDYRGLTVKVPIGWNELALIRELHSAGVQINCTCCMSVSQAIMAADAGARYVSLFYNRIRDINYDASLVVQQVRAAFDKHAATTQIIAGSIRHAYDVSEAVLAGAHIVTVPPKFFPQLVAHPKTDEAVAQFVRDFEAWQRPAVVVDKQAVRPIRLDIADGVAVTAETVMVAPNAR